MSIYGHQKFRFGTVGVVEWFSWPSLRTAANDEFKFVDLGEKAKQARLN